MHNNHIWVELLTNILRISYWSIWSPASSTAWLTKSSTANSSFLGGRLPAQVSVVIFSLLFLKWKENETQKFNSKSWNLSEKSFIEKKKSWGIFWRYMMRVQENLRYNKAQYIWATNLLDTQLLPASTIWLFLYSQFLKFNLLMHFTEDTNVFYYKAGEVQHCKWSQWRSRSWSHCKPLKIIQVIKQRKISHKNFVTWLRTAWASTPSASVWSP